MPKPGLVTSSAGPSVTRWSRQDGLLLAGIVLLAVGSRLGLYLHFRNLYYPDEIFQTMEPAYRLVTGQGVVAWEWREGIRSWLFPGLLAGIIAAGRAAGLSDASAIDLSALLLCLASASVLAVGYDLGRERLGTIGGVLVASVVLTCPDLIYFAPKALTEVVAAHVLIVAGYLAKPRALLASWPDHRRCFVLGMLLGLAFCLRFHVALALLVLAVAACGLDWRGRWVPLLLGGTAVLLPSGGLDWLTLGTPFQSVWKNFYVNVVLNKSASFGTSPWDALIIDLGRQWGPTILPFAVAFAWGFRREKAMGLAALAIFLTHSLIAHKELRFIYPAIPLFVVVAGLGALDGALALSRRFAVRPNLALVVTFGSLVLLQVGTATAPIYQEMWHRSNGAWRVQREAVRSGPICGIGIVDVPWVFVGAFSRMPVPAPRYWFPTQVPFSYFPFPPGHEADVPTPALAAFNVAFLTRNSRELPGFARPVCFGEFCVARRDGPCSARPEYELNRGLAAAGL